MREFIVNAKVSGYVCLETNAASDEAAVEAAARYLEEADFGDYLQNIEWNIDAVSGDEREVTACVTGCVKLDVFGYGKAEAASYASEFVSEIDFGVLRDVEWEIGEVEE